MSVTDCLLINDDGTIDTYVGPELSEHLPPVVREGLARRRLTALGETCPCGARMVVPNRAARRAARRGGVAVLTVPIEHEPDCAAVCRELLEGRWGR